MSQPLSNPPDELRKSNVVQQPRRFACDRCRKQKLRCERDTWRPSLMPCKRCRKAQMKCTISSAIDRPIPRRSKPKIDIEARKKKGDHVFTENSEDIESRTGWPPDHASDMISPACHRMSLDVSSPDIINSTSHARPISFDSAFNKIQSDAVLHNECYWETVDFRPLINPFFSGLITPPSLDGDREYQAPIHGPNSSSHHQRWMTRGNSQACHELFELEGGVDYFHDSGNEEEHYQHGYYGRLLEYNFQLSQLRQRVSRKLSNPSQPIPQNQTSCHLAVLQSAVQDVLEYSLHFMEILKGSIVSNRPTAPSQSLPTVSTVTSPLLTASRSVNQNISPRRMQSQTFFPTPTSEHQPDKHSDGFGISDLYDEVDAPVIFAVMSCYTCLFGIYGIILFELQQFIVFSSFSDDNLSAALIGYTAATTNTGSNREYLQLQLMFGQSVHMLAQVETCLGLPEQYCVAAAVARGSEDGSLRNTVAVALLDALVGQGYGTCSLNGLENDGERRSLKEIIRTINQYFGMF